MSGSGSFFSQLFSSDRVGGQENCKKNKERECAEEEECGRPMPGPIAKEFHDLFQLRRPKDDCTPQEGDHGYTGPLTYSNMASLADVSGPMVYLFQYYRKYLGGLMMTLRYANGCGADFKMRSDKRDYAVIGSIILRLFAYGNLEVRIGDCVHLFILRACLHFHFDMHIRML